MANQQLEQVVSDICNRGCRYVNQVLKDNQVRLDCTELAALRATDQEIVLAELRAVMSVYDQSGNCEI